MNVKKEMTMLKLQLGEFLTLIERDGWTREQDQDIVSTVPFKKEVWNGRREEFDVIDAEQIYGWASKASKLKVKGAEIGIIYTEGFTYERYNKKSFNSSNEGLDDSWVFDGFYVVDEQGEELSESDLVSYLFDTHFDEISYDFIDFDEVVDITAHTNDVALNDVGLFMLEIDNAPNIRFKGELIAKVASSDNRAFNNFSGSTGRWTELALYQAQNGKYICHQIEHTRWVNEHTRYSGKICDDLNEAMSFFGDDWLAQSLREEILFNDEGAFDEVQPQTFKPKP